MSLRILRYCLALLCFTAGPVWAQSVWFELGWAYDETTELEFTSGAKIGLRGVYPLNRTVGLYLAPYLFTGFEIGVYSVSGAGVDAGVWYDFLASPQDLEGFHSYAGVGLTFLRSQFGAVISGALSYEITRNTELAFLLNYRPLVTPSFSQAFDVSLGVRYGLD